jgi:hypothetical protein
VRPINLIRPCRINTPVCFFIELGPFVRGADKVGHWSGGRCVRGGVKSSLSRGVPLSSERREADEIFVVDAYAAVPRFAFDNGKSRRGRRRVRTPRDRERPFVGILRGRQPIIQTVQGPRSFNEVTMPTERLSVPEFRDVPRMKFQIGLSEPAIAVAQRRRGRRLSPARPRGGAFLALAGGPGGYGAGAASSSAGAPATATARPFPDDRTGRTPISGVRKATRSCRVAA